MRRSELMMLAYVMILLLSLAPALVIHPTNLAAASLVRVTLFAISIYVYFYTAHGPSRQTEPAISVVFYAGMISAAFACLDFVFQFPPPAGFGPQYIWLASGVYRRAQGVFYEASTLGNVCVFFLIFIATSLLRPQAESKVSRPALATGAAVFVGALILSFSRASLLNLGIALTALLYVNRRRIRVMRLAVFTLTGTLIAGAATLVFAPQALEFYFMRMLGSMELLAAGNEAVLSGRVATWNFIGSYLAEHPVQAMIGVGYKTLPYSDFIGRQIVADNAYLSALLETGILGLAGILLLNLAILRIAFRSASFYGQWIGCFWIGQMFQMLSGDLLTYWRVLPVYFWVLALAAREARAEHS
jgi:O-antigen ligase